MYELIKEWEQDGFELRAYTTPDETMGHPNAEFPQMYDDDTQATYINRYEQGNWFWVGVVVEATMQGIELGSASLWGIESDMTEYHQQVADELADEAIHEANTTLTRLLDQHAQGHA